jgi:hypothetical protein
MKSRRASPRLFHNLDQVTAATEIEADRPFCESATGIALDARPLLHLLSPYEQPAIISHVDLAAPTFNLSVAADKGLSEYGVLKASAFTYN